MFFEFLFFLILPLHIFTLSLNHCDYGDLKIQLLCRGEPYEGSYSIELFDQDFLFDESIDTATGYLLKTSSPVPLRAFVPFDDCRDVALYLKIISGCPKDLNLNNYGVTVGFEMARRLVAPELAYETCYTVPKNFYANRPIIVDLQEHPFCGLLEM